MPVEHDTHDLDAGAPEPEARDGFARQLRIEAMQDIVEELETAPYVLGHTDRETAIVDLLELAGKFALPGLQVTMTTRPVGTREGE